MLRAGRDGGFETPNVVYSNNDGNDEQLHHHNRRSPLHMSIDRPAVVSVEQPSSARAQLLPQPQSTTTSFTAIRPSGRMALEESEGRDRSRGQFTKMVYEEEEEENEDSHSLSEPTHDDPVMHDLLSLSDSFSEISIECQQSHIPPHMRGAMSATSSPSTKRPSPSVGWRMDIANSNGHPAPLSQSVVIVPPPPADSTYTIPTETQPQLATQLLPPHLVKLQERIAHLTQQIQLLLSVQSEVERQISTEPVHRLKEENSKKRMLKRSYDPLSESEKRKVKLESEIKRAKEERARLKSQLKNHLQQLNTTPPSARVDGHTATTTTTTTATTITTTATTTTPTVIHGPSPLTTPSTPRGASLTFRVPVAPARVLPTMQPLRPSSGLPAEVASGPTVAAASAIDWNAPNRSQTRQTKKPKRETQESGYGYSGASELVKDMSGTSCLEANIRQEIGDLEIDYNDLDFGQRLGKGAYGEVFRAELNGQVVAVKRLLLLQMDTRPLALKTFRREMICMKRTQHEKHIMPLIGACITNEYCCIVMQLMNQGSLHDMIFVKHTMFSLEQSVRILTDIARGMCILHKFDPPIIHRYVVLCVCLCVCMCVCVHA
eukprot:TRINITY_DN184_c2_g1_i4.p1 TRINITY_DN184_c2_g1~~TRINITY_DN184_c2_g1_i4.p1  ORF type:complete len:604 (+),score=107.22 TRINITY_DN184_c2_g1_i4:326-2137(+)